MKKEPTPEQLYKRRAGKYATKVRRQIKKEGLRSGRLLLEYYQKPNPSPSSLQKLDLKQEDIIHAIETEILKHVHSLPT